MARGAGAKTLIDIGIMACVMITFNKVSQNMVFQDRSFFSVVKVEALEHKLGTTHRFAHGDTIHNYQLRAPDLQTIPLAYYTRGGTFDKALSGKRRVQDAPLNVAMIGLGAGAMACYERAGDDWTYFEIDPVIVKMATNPDRFSTLSFAYKRSYETLSQPFERRRCAVFSYFQPIVGYFFRCYATGRRFWAEGTLYENLAR